MAKRVKRYKLLVKKEISLRNTTYSKVAIVNNAVLYI